MSKRSLSKGKRNRELESVHLSQIEKETSLSEQRSLHDYLDKKAERAFQEEFTAQTRLSEAEAELEKRELDRTNADVACSL